MRFLLTVLAGLALCLAGCSSSAPQPSTQGASTSVPRELPTIQPTSGPPPSSGAPGLQVPGLAGNVGEGDVRRVAESWAAAGSFRAKMEMKQGDDTGEMLLEVARPDRQRMKITSQGQDIEMVQIGTDSYTNFGGQWIKATTGAIPTLNIDPDEMVKDFRENADNGDIVSKGGLSVVEGAPCQEWINNSADPKQAGTMCIGLLDNLPREFKSADGSIQMTFYDWNVPIAIDPPI